MLAKIKRKIYNQNFFRKRSHFLVIALITFLVPLSVHAFILEAITGVAILAIVGGILIIVKGILIAFISLLADGTTSILSVSAINVPVVEESWNLVRQFANMFFIVILIVMAFYTIFDLGGYDFKTLIGRFIVAALLINFSLVIGEIIIGWSQTLSNVFINAIGDVGARIAQGTGIANQVVGDLSNSAAATADANLWQKTISFFATIILLSIVFFSMAVLFFFSILRVPVLWALLIFSPLAWITYILPSTKKINQDWWKYFIGWNVFMPVYLFFIYFGTLFLQKKNTILAGINSGSSSGLGITFQSLFFFILVGIVLIGGAKFAMNFGMAAGAGGVAAGVWAKGRTAARFAGTRIPIFGGYSARDIGGAYQEAKQHIQKEGFAGTPLEKIPGIGGYRGERGYEDRVAKIAGAFGVPGVREKQIQRNVEAAEKRLRDKGLLARPDELAALMNNTGASSEDRIAASRLLRTTDRELNGKESVDMFNLAGGERSVFANKLLAETNLEGMTREDREYVENNVNVLLNRPLYEKLQMIKSKKREYEDSTQWLRAAETFRNDAQRSKFVESSKDFLESLSSDNRREILTRLRDLQSTESAKELALIMADRPRDIDQATALALTEVQANGGLFTNAPDRQYFLNKLQKKRPTIAIRTKAEHGLIQDSGGNILSPDAALIQESRKLGANELIELSPEEITNIAPHIVGSLNLEKMKRIEAEADEQRLNAFMPFIQQRRTGLANDLLNQRRGPLNNTLNRLSQLTQAIRTAVGNNRPQEKEAAINQAKEGLDRAGKLIQEIEDIQHASQAEKDQARQEYDTATRAYYQATQEPPPAPRRRAGFTS